MTIINARITFKDSHIHILEQFTFHNVINASKQFQENAGLSECVIVQTCNRVELFGTGNNIDVTSLVNTWASLTDMSSKDFEENMNISYDSEACYHLLSLVTGLDSMVIGEEQILGQIKDSITIARDSKTSGHKLNLLFDKAIRSGTAIRNQTQLNQGGMSVGSMAVKLVEDNITDMKSKKILLIGTGEVSTLVAKSFLKRNYEFDVTSRTLPRAEMFCTAIGGTAVPFEQILTQFKKYDVLFVATSAPYFLVTYERIVKIMNEKDSIMIMDLSNPRTVDEKVATLNGVRLMNLDQISEMVNKNAKHKTQKTKLANELILQQTTDIESALRRNDMEPTIARLFQKADDIRVRELSKALKSLGEDDPNKIKILEKMSESISEGIMSAPVGHLRDASENNDSDLVNLICKLFNQKIQSSTFTTK